ncbi:MAG: DUF1801 domain-containing protein [Acidimicrobiia bacterium]|nr:DUF1801 domain-containing protein [Acidimicrobiia bacterium]
MPGWKGDIGRQLHALIVATVPDVAMAVRWNSPFYGIEGNGWFVSYHCFPRYVKVTFLTGSGLDPLPPVDSKHETVRYLHVSDESPLDETQFVDWIRQASTLPGADMF